MAFSTYSVVVAAKHVAAKIGAVREPPSQGPGANGSASLRGRGSTEPVPSEVEGLTTPGRKRLATPCALSLSKGAFPRKRESGIHDPLQPPNLHCLHHPPLKIDNSHGMIVRIRHPYLP